MKRRLWLVVVALLGTLVCLVIVFWLAAPLWQKMGVQPFCIQGDWPEVKIAACEPVTPVVTVTPLPMPALDGPSPLPLIFDDDGSPDGMIALLYFLNSPLYDVRAVTISYGEAHPDVFARHAARLLAGLGRDDIPVGAGRDAPLAGSNAFPDPWREVSDQFWGLDLPEVTDATAPVPAAQLIVDTISQSDQPVTVFVSGAHTNLAEALRLEPGIAQKIRAVYVMGGSIYVPGNIKSSGSGIDNEAAEWNIYVDPLAAQEVFSSGLSLHLVPLDATHQVTWTKEDMAGWRASGSPEGALAADLLRYTLESWSQNDVYIWDLVTAVQATNPAVCPEVDLALEVVTTPGRLEGQTAVTDGEANAFVCLNPDAGQVKSLAAFVLGRGR